MKKKAKKWLIVTSTYKAIVDHSFNMNAMEASVIAFQKKAPKYAGTLTMCTHPDGTEYYVSSERASRSSNCMRG